MNDTCPGCGAEEKRRYCDDEDKIVVMGCGTDWCVSQEDGHLFPVEGNVSHKCLTRQLAQRDELIATKEMQLEEATERVNNLIESRMEMRERIKELESELLRPKHEVLRQLAETVERYEYQSALLLALKPIVRAAINQELWDTRLQGRIHISGRWGIESYDEFHRHETACQETEVAVRALTPEQRARIEEVEG